MVVIGTLQVTRSVVFAGSRHSIPLSRNNRPINWINLIREVTEIIVDMYRLAFSAVGLVLIQIFILTGCNTNVSPEDLERLYFLQGGVVKNLDNNSAMAVIEFHKNDTLYPAAKFALDIDTADYDTAHGYYRIFYDSASALAAGNHKLAFSDPPNLNDSVIFSVPDDFVITYVSIEDDTRINNGGHPVQLSWELSIGSVGYVMVAIMKDSAYGGTGYAEFTTNNYATVPRDAFSLSGNVNQPDTGWYYVYVYSYFGSPDFNSSLPAAIPPGLTNNIMKFNLAGKFGALTVAGHDSIHVVIQ
jgi:hypothetical protein